jgi:hypothetical protein
LLLPLDLMHLLLVQSRLLLLDPLQMLLPLLLLHTQPMTALQLWLQLLLLLLLQFHFFNYCS